MSGSAHQGPEADRQKTTHRRREPLGPACLLRRRGPARLSDYSGRDHTEAQPVHPNWSTARTPGPGLNNTPEGLFLRVRDLLRISVHAARWKVCILLVS